MAVKLRLVFGILLGGICLVGFSLPRASAQTVAQGYTAAAPLQVGEIVQLVPGSANKVKALTQSSASKAFGVVINPNTSALSLSQANLSSQVYVESSGNYPVLVNNENGPIYSGDFITISTVSGIGDKALSTDSTVVGKATTNFLGSGDSIGQVTVKNSSGKNTILQIGTITVNINVTGNPADNSSILPSFIQKLGKDLTNKPVSTIRSYLSLLILVASLVIAGSILYAGIRSSITAVGRNPLSKNPVMRSMLQVILTSFIVVILGVFAVYLLLKY
jgi:hypothetical protein